MADMYGALCSNYFKVKDVKAFKTWFDGYWFGETVVWGIGDDEGFLSFGGYQQYPNAYPRVNDDDEFPDADLEVFARELREHLCVGERLHVVAGGNEKLRYVAFSQLAIDHEAACFRTVSSNDDLAATSFLCGED